MKNIARIQTTITFEDGTMERFSMTGPECPVPLNLNYVPEANPRLNIEVKVRKIVATP